MITDIGTVFWKEWREYLSNASGGNTRSRGILYMGLIVVFSLFIAIAMARFQRARLILD